MACAWVRTRRLWAALGLLSLIGWLLMVHFGLIVGCPVEAVTGLECAFRGGTRANEALLSGDVGRAIDLNLFYTVLALPLSALALVTAVGPAHWAIRVVVAYRRLGPRRLLPRVGFALLILWTVARNLPGLAWLAAG